MVLALSAQTARACETVATARLDSECVVMARQGVRGVWFTLAAADELRASHQLVPELRFQLEKSSEVDQKRTREVANLREALALQKGVSAKLKDEAALNAKAARDAQEEAAKAQASLDSWWRTPVIWGVAGALAGVLAALAIVSR